jgi:hypothetical protein
VKGECNVNCPLSGARTWKLVIDFNNVGRWHPDVTESRLGRVCPWLATTRETIAQILAELTAVTPPWICYSPQGTRW